MVCAELNSDLGFILRPVIAIMSCIFGCFRFKDDNRPHSSFLSDAISSKSGEDPLASQNRLASLFLSEEKEGNSLESPCKDNIDRELKDEAKFLKNCGTLLETPVEIRKKFGRVKDLPNDGDSETSKFHSWLSSASIKKLHREEQSNLVPISPVKLCDVLGKESGSSEHKPTSCMSKGHKPVGRNSSRSPECSETDSPHTEIEITYYPNDNDEALSTQRKNKIVRFECQSDTAVLSLSGQSSKQSDSSGSHSGSKRSPYPTPLKLTNEMQTPGTVYPVSLENLADGKNNWIRSQYVYTVLNPAQKALIEEDSYSHKQPEHLRESLEQSENASPEHTSVSYKSKSTIESEGAATVGKGVQVDGSLSQWLKSSSSPKDGVQSCKSISSGRTHSGKMPERDRPILGTVAAHWNEYEPSSISPKWWDGNGIPNSTNKYKEDQRVNWHATPFEERLEKALSDESLVYQRRLPNGRPVHFDENEENDTAVSRLQSSNHPESVVSF